MNTPYGIDMDAVEFVEDVVGAVLSGRRKATKYLSPSVVIKATARHKPNKRARNVEMILTIGKPNYVEREFIRDCKRAGERLPVKRVQVKEWK